MTELDPGHDAALHTACTAILEAASMHYEAARVHNWQMAEDMADTLRLQAAQLLRHHRAEQGKTPLPEFLPSGFGKFENN